MTVDLIDIEQEIFKRPQKVSLWRSASCTTKSKTAVWVKRMMQTLLEQKLNSTNGHLREPLAEAKSAADREKELDEESVGLDKQVAADIRGNPGFALKDHRIDETPGTQMF